MYHIQRCVIFLKSEIEGLLRPLEGKATNIQTMCINVGVRATELPGNKEETGKCWKLENV